jgi:F0F1-type ATP synthase membrane subunit c/vacuolar-type H+-ATPase subunit K
MVLGLVGVVVGYSSSGFFSALISAASKQKKTHLATHGTIQCKMVEYVVVVVVVVIYCCY